MLVVKTLTSCARGLGPGSVPSTIQGGNPTFFLGHRQQIPAR